MIDALLFSLSIAAGISPQLLPAVVSTSLAEGSRQLAQRKVLVKRLVCIEDLGDIDVLFTDKTCTLTEGRLRFMRSTGPDGFVFDVASDDVNTLVKDALQEHAEPLDDSHVVTGVSGNTVTLIGHVRTRAQRDAVVRAAWRGHAVMAVVDQIEITG